jgi:hypothetical protein
VLYNGPSTHVCEGHSQNVGAKLKYHFILSPIIYRECSQLTLGLYPKHKWTKSSSMPPFLTSRLAFPLSFYNEALQGFFFCFVFKQTSSWERVFICQSRKEPFTDHMQTFHNLNLKTLHVLHQRRRPASIGHP